MSKVSNAIKDARDATVFTGLDTLRKIERILIDADSDDADMCLPHIESLILFKAGSPSL